jgi:hypothetical protein
LPFCFVDFILSLLPQFLVYHTFCSEGKISTLLWLSSIYLSSMHSTIYFS